jgi:hypothetical protein
MSIGALFGGILALVRADSTVLVHRRISGRYDLFRVADYQ